MSDTTPKQRLQSPPPSQPSSQSPASNQPQPGQNQPTSTSQQPLSPSISAKTPSSSSQASASKTTAASASPSKQPVSQKVLLLVEDDPLLINMYQTKFSKEGFQVFTATDGEAGLMLAKSEKPQIIILDIMMPKLDGIEVLRRISQDPNLKNVPVLMLSNLSEVAKQKEALRLGAKEFLIKANLTPSQVVARIRQYLNNNQPTPTQ